MCYFYKVKYFMSMFHVIDGVKIPFDKDWRSIAISLSGGADSALLCYILCNLAKRSGTIVHVINHVRCWKSKPWQQDNAEYIVNWFKYRFPEIKFERHINFIAPELEYGSMGPSLTDEYDKKVSGDNIQQRAYAEYICHKHNIDAYYNAVTRNPRQESFDGMRERDIDPTEDNAHLSIMKHMGRYACHPFRFIDKSWIVKQYKSFGIFDLFEKTRSCEGEFKSVNYTNYTPGQYVPVCGTCFWCKEREWAIEQNK